MVSLCDGILNRFDPLGARCIMGVIESEGDKFDSLLQDRLLSRAEIMQSILQQQPSIVWISVQPETLGLLEFLTTLSSSYEGPIIIGNVGSRGLLAEELKLLRSNIVIVLGQGENAALDLYKLLKKNKVFNEADLIKINNLRYFSFTRNELIETDTAYSSLAKTTKPSQLQLKEAIERGDIITVRSSSGCNFSCVFCTVRDINNKQRYVRHNKDTLREHITVIIKNGMKEGIIRFVDDDLAGDIMNVSIITDIFNQLNKEYNTNLEFGFSTRASHFVNNKDSEQQVQQRIEIWKNAANAGLKALFLGLESGSTTQLKRLGKSTKAIYNFQAASIAQSLGIQLEIGFIPIDPFMTDDNWRKEMRDNISLARHVNVVKTCPTWLAPMRAYDGSPMVTWLKKLSLLRNKIEDTDEYTYDYVSSEVKHFIELLGPSFCAGKKNGVYDLKREIKYAQWYPCGIDKYIEKNCSNILNAELCFVERLLDADLFGEEAVFLQLDYIDILEKNISELENMISSFKEKKLTVKMQKCCKSAFKELHHWKTTINLKSTLELAG